MEVPDTIALSSSELQQYCDDVHVLIPEDEVHILGFTLNFGFTLDLPWIYSVRSLRNAKLSFPQYSPMTSVNAYQN